MINEIEKQKFELNSPKSLFLETNTSHSILSSNFDSLLSFNEKFENSKSQISIATSLAESAKIEKPDKEKKIELEKLFEEIDRYERNYGDRKIVFPP